MKLRGRWNDFNCQNKYYCLINLTGPPPPPNNNNQTLQQWIKNILLMPPLLIWPGAGLRGIFSLSVLRPASLSSTGNTPSHS